MIKLKILKALVFFMTFLLIFGILCSAMLIYQKISAPKTAATDILLNQPQGSYISDYRIDNNIMYVLVKGGSEADRIISVNLKNKTLGAAIKTY